GTNSRRADLPLAVRRVAEGDVAGELTHLDRRERRRDVAGDPVLQRGLRGGRTPDDDLGLRLEGGGEEDQPLDVVEVQVREQDVETCRLVAAGEAEAADPGPGVEGEQRSVGEGDLDAGGVAPVADRLRARRGHRAAGSPELQVHSQPPRVALSLVGQKKAIPPREPCGVRIGSAETSISCSEPSAERIRSSAWAGRPSRIVSTTGSSS